MLLYPRHGKTSPGADLSIFPLKTKVCSIQTVNYRDISAAGISSIVFHHVTVLSSFLSLVLITQRRRHSPFTGQKRRVWQKGCVKKHWVLPDQLLQGGWAKLRINKQPGCFRAVERTIWLCQFLFHWGTDRSFFFPECMLEQLPAPLKPLQLI